MGKRAALLLVLLASGARAQDELRLVSPNGRLEFRLFVAQPEVGALYRLGYQLLARGKPVLGTSFLGLVIHDQEPVLCENVGLTASHSGAAGDYRWLTAEYMQNGSIGRRVNLEVRLWDDGLAFRYVLPRSSALEDLLIDDEWTEFDFAQGGPAVESGALPVSVRQAGVGWLTIASAGGEGYPPVRLVNTSGNILSTRLTPIPGKFGVALEGHTPFTGPWRVVLIGTDAAHASESVVLRELVR